MVARMPEKVHISTNLTIFGPLARRNDDYAAVAVVVSRLFIFAQVDSVVIISANIEATKMFLTNKKLALNSAHFISYKIFCKMLPSNRHF